MTGIPVDPAVLLSTAMDSGTALYRALEFIRQTLREQWNVPKIITTLGEHGIHYTAAAESEEPDEGDYATVGFVLPDYWFAEIENGTYGQLQGLRIYRADLFDIPEKEAPVGETTVTITDVNGTTATGIIPSVLGIEAELDRRIEDIAEQSIPRQVARSAIIALVEALTGVSHPDGLNNKGFEAMNGALEAIGAEVITKTFIVRVYPSFELGESIDVAVQASSADDAKDKVEDGTYDDEIVQGARLDRGAYVSVREHNSEVVE